MLMDDNLASNIISSDDLHPDMIIRDFDIYGDMIFFCGSIGNQGFIARALLSIFTNPNAQFFMSEINTLVSVDKLKVYPMNDPIYPDGLQIAAIGTRIAGVPLQAHADVYVNYIVNDRHINGAETYDMFERMLTTVEESFEDVIVTEDYVVVLGKTYNFFGFLTLRIHDKYNPFIYSNYTFMYYDYNINEDMIINDLNLLNLDNNSFILGAFAHSIQGFPGIYSGIIISHINIEYLQPIYDTPIITGVNKQIHFLKNLYYNNDLNRVYALATNNDDNFIFTFNNNYNSYPYIENFLQITKNQYDSEVYFSDITRHNFNVLKLAGMDYGNCLHLFEKVISNQEYSPCHENDTDLVDIIGGIYDSFSPVTISNSYDAPSSSHIRGNIYSGTFYETCIE